MKKPLNPFPALPGPGCDRCQNTGHFFVGHTWAQGCPVCGRLVEKTIVPPPAEPAQVVPPPAPPVSRAPMKVIAPPRILPRGHPDHPARDYPKGGDAVGH